MQLQVSSNTVRARARARVRVYNHGIYYYRQCTYLPSCCRLRLKTYGLLCRSVGYAECTVRCDDIEERSFKNNHSAGKDDAPSC